MIINLTYSKKLNSKVVSKKVREALGVREQSRVFEYEGMLFSLNKNNIRINTLLDNEHDMEFLNSIIDNVFQKSIVGISGYVGDKDMIKTQNNNVIWM